MTEPARLKTLALLRDFTDGEVAALALAARTRQLEAGARLWEVGAADIGLSLIVEGGIELSRATEFPERRVVMGIFGPGSVVGETIVFGATGMSLSAIAAEPTTLAEITPEALAGLAAASPEAHRKLLLAVLKVLSRRLTQAYERMSAVF